jgi:hypothetical protein
MVRYALEQHVFLYDACVKYRSARECRRKFRRKFLDESVTKRQRIHNLVSKRRSTGLLMDSKQKHKRRVLTEEKLDDMAARFEHAPRKSLKLLAQETGVSKPSAKRATQLSNLRHYKTTVIHVSLAVVRSSYQGSFPGWLLQSSKVRLIRN